jgi:sugar lactone lactonase YvrE
MLSTVRVGCGLLAAAVLVAVPGTLHAQADMAPTNNLPNPYRTVEGWAKLPDGRQWGSTSAVYVDPDGVHIWVGERCGANSCIGNDVNSILKFDGNGNLVASFGGGMINWPHGIHVDRQGNVWVTDGRDNRSAGATGDQVFGHQVHKFSPTGQHLMTLGEKGGQRVDGHFWQPNDVLVAPNGDIFVAEGHGNNPESSNARIFKFNSQGQLLKIWGTMGTGPTDLMQPHALAMDSQGRLFVGDRSNDRIQIYDQEGNHLDTWYQFSRPSGIFIDASDNIYVADSESGSVNPAHVAWFRGIRIGSARTGEVRYLIPDPDPNCRGTCTAEGVTVDRNGVIYGAEVGPVGGIKRYVRQ